ncbi:MAG TPA: hypothetical protein VHQ90_21175 [Thermoanaerobaculia bacterium]|nr:hypothetical protein [Thermoanaerobaculia bacterium]
MHLDEFKLEAIIFELRYAPAYLFWDRAGSLWKQMVDRHPTLQVKEAQPGKTVFLLENRAELEVTMSSLRVVAQYPDKLDEFSSLVSGLTACSFETLEIASLDRIGLRSLYFKAFRSKSEVAAALAACPLFAIPQEKYYDGNPRGLEAAYRFEGQASLVTMRLRGEGRRIDFDPPRGLSQLRPLHEETEGVTLDVDCASSVTIPVSQFHATEWISQWHHIVRRDSKKMLEGTR